MFKNIILENDSIRLNFLRQFNTEENKELLRDIIDEGVDMYDVCDFDGVFKYAYQIMENSAITFLHHWFDGNEKYFEKYKKDLIDMIYDRHYFEIYHYFYDKKSECEE